MADGITKVPAAIQISVNGNVIDRAVFNDADLVHIYDTLWKGMERENNFINYRLSWMIFLTSGFVSAQGFVFQAIVSLHTPSIQGGACFLLAGLSAAALYAATRGSNAVGAAVAQISYLKYYYVRTTAGDKGLFEFYYRLPRPFGDQSAHKLGNTGAKAFPPIIVGLWLALFVIEFVAGTVYICHTVNLGAGHQA